MKKIIKNKKAMEFASAFYTIVAVSIVIIALGVWVNDWDLKYGSGLTYDLTEDYNKLNEMSAEASKQEGNISVRSSDQDSRFEDSTLRAVFGFLNNIFKPFRVVFGNNGMIDSVTERFGIPDYVRQGIVTIMIFAVTMALVAVFFRLPRRRA